MQPLFSRLSADKVRTYSLVLSAVGVAHRVHRQGPVWSIEVRPDQRGVAVEAIALYLKENPARQPDRGQFFPVRGARTYSALYVAAILSLIHFLIAPGVEQGRFVAAFGADAARIMSGELYRCATALLLHADIPHLLGNVAGLVLFGTVAASLCGWGLGWCMVLAAGFAGNWITAWWYGDNHLSVGSSTAVFGAMGICTVLSLWNSRRRKNRKVERTWRGWIPLAGGLALLGLLGTAPQADLMAHLSGFASGIVFAGAGVLVFRRLPYGTPAWLEWTAAIVACAWVAVCWLRGMAWQG